jgi:phosphate transport system substrate-binding protein
MNRFFNIITILLGTILLSSCAKKQQELKISGGTAHLKIMQVMAKKFQETHPNLKVSITGGGSGVGIKQVGEGIVDIGNSGRNLKESELLKYPILPHRIAIDAIAVIVNPDCKIKSLTTKQLTDIFSGKITNWKELGGNDAKINIYSRDKNSGTRSTFQKVALNSQSISDAANIVKSNGDMKVNIARDKNSIGYMSFGNLDNTVTPVIIDQVEINIENITSHKYKIQRSLFSVTQKKESEIVKDFIALLLSDWGQNVVKEHKFIPVK